MSGTDLAAAPPSFGGPLSSLLPNVGVAFRRSRWCCGTSDVVQSCLVNTGLPDDETPPPWPIPDEGDAAAAAAIVADRTADGGLLTSSEAVSSLLP